MLTVLNQAGHTPGTPVTESSSLEPFPERRGLYTQTKLAAEAVVFFNLDLVRDFELRRKRAGHLLSKMRYASAQLLAYIESGVWLRNATHANRLAAQIAAALPARLVLAAEANEVFLRLSATEAATLRDQGFAFYDWGAADSGEYRFVVSWQQAPGDALALAKALRALP